MACDGCNKPKTVHVTEIKGGKKVEKHLCKDCPYANEGVPAGKGGHQPINELLTNFVLATTNAAQQQGDACPETGLTWQEFRNSGLLGHECNYDVFEKQLTPLLQRAHEGATHHVGKRPDRGARGAASERKRQQRELGKLRRELTQAIEAEDYELAASLRDKVKAVEGGGDGAAREADLFESNQPDDPEDGEKD